MGEHYVRRPRLLDLSTRSRVLRSRWSSRRPVPGRRRSSSAWTAESSTPTAWLSLDETDRDAVSFWSHVIAALETLAPKCGDRALAMLRRPGSRADAVHQLLVDLEAEVRPTAILVIDDFHLVDDDDFVVESVSRFVQNQPRWLRLVLVVAARAEACRSIA